ncbi:hypothetical protein T265_00433 [Opisthorchis viverrini]|uniref:S1 motif domain-containing protein n=1 Tax=Opisthorchis viverrini TaxID=6198 RepID=A0A075A221_OPIVI|nr:hypothetical protein T265_00433 [Opisthorchis viverrini]KER33753.1 hypothetical protein T265_00433 [Opisthorchis viverrini]
MKFEGADNAPEGLDADEEENQTVQVEDRIRVRIIGLRVDASDIFAVGTLMDDYLGLQNISTQVEIYLPMPSSASPSGADQPKTSAEPTTRQADPIPPKAERCNVRCAPMVVEGTIHSSTETMTSMGIPFTFNGKGVRNNRQQLDEVTHDPLETHRRMEIRRNYPMPSLTTARAQQAPPKHAQNFGQAVYSCIPKDTPISYIHAGKQHEGLGIQSLNLTILIQRRLPMEKLST